MSNASRKLARSHMKRLVRANPAYRTIGVLPKISETLIDFAEPILDIAGEDELRCRVALDLATLVWNGLVEARPMDEIVAALEQVFGAGAGARRTAEALAERKQELFADDQRFIVAVDLYQEDGEFRVNAAYRLTPQ